MATSKSLYHRVVDVSTEYLGPTGERFISRQIVTHLNKEPERLTKQDIPKLTEWVKLTFALLTDDSELVDSFANDLDSLARTPKKSPVTDA